MTRAMLNIALTATLEAGEAILDIYRKSDFEVEIKADNSPLTIADRSSHEIIYKELLKTGLPILSEEGKEIPYDTRKKWDLFWMVDPLDGTKEFINRNGEFTVNIALIHGQTPVAGIILAPVMDLLYIGITGEGSYRITNVPKDLSWLHNDNLSSYSELLPLIRHRSQFIAVASRSHSNEKTQLFLGSLKNEHGQIELLSKGSSLKFCLIAEGSADVYPRFGPTYEWDTAAGQAIVDAAGGRVIGVGTGERMSYNKELLLNPEFIALGYKPQATSHKPYKSL